MDQITVDYTKARLGSRPGTAKIARCPKCGRKGEFVLYDNASWRCFHKGRAVALGIIITDGCYGKGE